MTAFPCSPHRDNLTAEQKESGYFEEVKCIQCGQNYWRQKPREKLTTAQVVALGGFPTGDSEY
jgi:ribosomal protein S26